VRTAFIEQLCESAAQDDRIWLVCGDLGYSVLEIFANAFPKRYLNAGVAEQNMTGVAAGLAMSGKIVFTYSIANFPVMRCLEQIRNDVCYHHLNVKIVSVGGGMAYGTHGYTHHGVEDLAVMRALPNMNVVAPGDPIEARGAVKALVADPGPAYLRLGKAGEPIVHTAPINFFLGQAIPLLVGSQVTLFTTGGALKLGMDAAFQLEEMGISVGLISMPSVAPIDQEVILRAARETGFLVSIEEHGPGGLGTAIAEILAEEETTVRFIPVRLRHEIIKTAGSQEYLRSALGVSKRSIVEAVIRGLSSRGSRENL
jgi:transketolase